MKLTKFLKDRLFALAIALFALLVLLGLLLLFRAPSELLFAAVVVWLLMLLAMLGVEYGRKRGFYRKLEQCLALLDQKYLVLEMLQEPDFYEGRLVWEALCEINKSMAENVKKYRRSIEDFKDYIELWVHEVKLPIASLQLMCHNNREAADAKFEAQLRRLDGYTDQVLYFVRSENAHKDYLIKSVRLSDVVRRTAVKHKDDLLLNGIVFSAEVPETVCVTTDGKWLEFMLGQLLSNSMKYKKTQEESRICVSAASEGDSVYLHVRDNGIGIPEEDLPRVFEKSFTGENGRLGAKSTGMGLYIVKLLCGKLGHGITVQSVSGEYTDVQIQFLNNDFYRMED